MSEPAAVAETHVSTVFFLADRAYKVKKPVRTGFLDFTTRAAREAACRREVELNRRFAPDVYLGVADVVGPDGEVCDHLVVMRRMAADRRLSHLVTEGVDVADALRAVARIVASAHAAAPPLPDAAAYAGPAAVRGHWDGCLATLRDHAGRTVPTDAVAELDRLATGYLAGRAPLLAARIRAGMVRDGHGDLLADDVFCLDDGPRILDCLEFDDRLRCGDVLADVAFLAMDLERLGRPDLADLFLDHYAELSAERHPTSLADHYVAYRATVRAAVACLRVDQNDRSVAELARTDLDLALRRSRRAEVRLVLVGGLPGTGKSTVAEAVAARRGWTVLRSDVVRKELAGIPPSERADARHYDAEWTARTYAELARRAERLLGLGETVVADATWHTAATRATAADLAQRTSSRLVEIECHLPAEIAAERIHGRVGDVSDATPAVAAAMAGEWEPWHAAAPLDTSGPPDAATELALRLPGLTDGTG